jgi:hypothetical protein
MCTTARFDREIKLPLYARHGIAEAWLLDLDTRQAEVCCFPLPESNDYAERTIISTGKVAAGTSITRHTPHRSVRAELLHTAPASGHDANHADGVPQGAFNHRPCALAKLLQSPLR